MGCRQVVSPEGLVRVALGDDGRLVVGPAPGRGAWLCRGPAGAVSPECFRRAVRHGAIGRALRATLPAEAMQHLAALLGAGPAGDQPHDVRE